MLCKQHARRQLHNSHRHMEKEDQHLSKCEVHEVNQTEVAAVGEDQEVSNAHLHLIKSLCRKCNSMKKLTIVFNAITVVENSEKFKLKDIYPFVKRNQKEFHK